MSPIQIEPMQETTTFELDVYGKRGLCLDRGEGCWVWDETGRRYLDCIAGHGSLNLGHSHPAVIDTIQRQARKLIACPGSFYQRPKMDYLKRLIEVCPDNMERAFLSNSGAESVEAALKFARISTGRSRIIAARRGFHGRTYGALSATAVAKYQKGFEPLVPDFRHVPFNGTEALAKVMDETVAAVILELVQGEAGVFPISAAYVRAAREMCDRFGALLIVDEVQTGFSRTGELFACRHFNLQPDILCLAKSIANGLPMGATVVGPKVTVAVGQHGSTFGGNPLVCAVAQTVLDTHEASDCAKRAARLGLRLRQRLENAELSKVRAIRGLGLMLGLELKVRVHPVLDRLMSQGVLALGAGSTVLRLLPPLTISEGELDFLVEALTEVLA